MNLHYEKLRINLIIAYSIGLVGLDSLNNKIFSINSDCFEK